MLVIAVTGGVACGKSTAVDELEQSLPDGRVARFDCDVAVSELLKTPEVVEQIGALEGANGELVREGKLRKKKLRKRAFDNSDFRERLEKVLHPLVLDLARQFCEKSRKFAGLALIEVPLLYEVEFPLDRNLDLVVAASRETQRERLQNERQLKGELADRIIASQLPIEEKIKRGDIVVWNDSRRDVLEEQIKHLARRCLPLFN